MTVHNKTQLVYIPDKMETKKKPMTRYTEKTFHLHQESLKIISMKTNSFFNSLKPTFHTKMWIQNKIRGQQKIFLQYNKNESIHQRG